MKILPIGIQSLSEIRAKNGVYVDKTQLVHQLVTQGKYYFLSRPRRFGKSLLISTFKELFEGNKALFEGLWIKNNWDWSKTNPVIHISFDTVDYDSMGLNDAILYELKEWADNYDIELEATSPKLQFKELLKKLNAKHGKVVVLIDEYDKPIIDYLEKDKIEQAKTNRTILREFYSVLKNADTQLELVFITGISKFAKVSLFSHLNNLEDITLHKKYGTLTGYTQEELEFYFKEYLQDIAVKLNITYDFLLNTMRV